MERLTDLLLSEVVQGARALIGCRIVTPTRAAIITETEAYRGEDDPACHAFRKPKMKNMALFGPPGTAYIYLNYGIHWMLNVAALPEGISAGILIRSARPESGFTDERLDGPGRLGRALGVNPEWNGLNLFDPEGEIRIEPAQTPNKILVGPRIGITKAQDLPWRFVDADQLKWVSRPHPTQSDGTERR